MPALSLDRVTLDVQRRDSRGRRLGMVRVLQDCSLDVADGEALTIMGPHTCGPSTVVDVLAGFTPPTRGAVIEADRPLNGPAGRGFVVPAYALLPHYSALDTVILASADADADAREVRGWEVLDMVGLAEKADTQAGELSVAQRQRLAVARALASRPRVLLLDDPFGALDAVERRVFADDLLRIRAEAEVALVIATPRLEEAVRISSRVAVLSPRPGRVHTTVAVDGDHVLDAARQVWTALHPPALSRAA